jgi:hypothetical protein
MREDEIVTIDLSHIPNGMEHMLNDWYDWAFLNGTLNRLAWKINDRVKSGLRRPPLRTE